MSPREGISRLACVFLLARISDSCASALVLASNQPQSRIPRNNIIIGMKQRDDDNDSLAHWCSSPERYAEKLDMTVEEVRKRKEAHYKASRDLQNYIASLPSDQGRRKHELICQHRFQHGKHPFVCPRCWSYMPICLCDEVVSKIHLPSPIQNVILLTHHREWGSISNSGSLLPIILQNTKMLMKGHPQHDEELAKLFRSDTKQVIVALWPDNDTSQGKTPETNRISWDDLNNFKNPITLLALEGTWRTARRMAAKLPSQVVKVAVPPDQVFWKSRDQKSILNALRRQRGHEFSKDNLCTVEAMAAALVGLGMDRREGEKILHLLERKVDLTSRYRYNRKIEETKDIIESSTSKQEPFATSGDEVSSTCKEEPSSTYKEELSSTHKDERTKTCKHEPSRGWTAYKKVQAQCRKQSLDDIQNLPDLVDFCHGQNDRIYRISLPNDGSTKDSFYQGPMYGIKGFPGFMFAPQAISDAFQIELAFSAVTEYCEAPHATNIDLVPPKSSEEIDLPGGTLWHLWKLCNGFVEEQEEGHSSFYNSKETEQMQKKYYRSFRKLSWATMGYQYDWTARAYHEGSKSPMPPVLGAVAAHFAMASLTAEYTTCATDPIEFAPSASIVNYYTTKSVMGGHRDDLEYALDKPVVSISLGLPAIFLLGGKSKEDTPVLPLLIRPGDVMILGGNSRLNFHGMAKVIPEETSIPNIREELVATKMEQVQPFSFQKYPRMATDEAEENDEKALRSFLSKHRININVRQVHKEKYASKITKTEVRE